MIKQDLMAKYKMTDLADMSWCLGIQVTRGKDAVLLSQSTMLEKPQVWFGMQGFLFDKVGLQDLTSKGSFTASLRTYYITIGHHPATPPQQ